MQLAFEVFKANPKVRVGFEPTIVSNHLTTSSVPMCMSCLGIL